MISGSGEQRQMAPRRKRKPAAATAAAKNPEEVESQRITHINVERNRRRLMNSHLNDLRRLMPPSFVRRGDQASIVGGAVEFVKHLEQRLLSLQAEKHSCTSSSSSSSTTYSTPSSSASTDDDSSAAGFFSSPQYTTYSQSRESGAADVEATVVQGFVNLKVAGRRRPGQLLHLVEAMEDLRLTLLHLTVTPVGAYNAFYSFNLKMEEECPLGSQEEVAAAVHAMFGCAGDRRG